MILATIIKRYSLRIWYELLPLWKPLGRALLLWIMVLVGGTAIIFVTEHHPGVFWAIVGTFFIIDRIYFFTRDKETRDKQSRKNIKLFIYVMILMALYNLYLYLT